MTPLTLVKHSGFAIASAWLATGVASDVYSAPTTPIEHVIVVVGENHTFDNVFGVYRPDNGQRVLNLLSQGIVDENGNPGPNFQLARQHTAMPPGTGTGHATYSLDPQRVGAYAALPQPNTTYATGQPLGVLDPRFPDDLKNGPFQISKYAPYDAFTGDPVHRFFQMWQQVSKGKNDLFVWVAETASTGNHTAGDASDFTAQGALAMGFYNMQTGDAPFFKEMARHYVIGDNYHQAIMGGTGANFQAIVTGDAAFYQDSSGAPTTPPTMVSALGTTVSEIENPDPQPAGSNLNWYTEDGYSGGSYVNCADATQPGVKVILDYLATLHVKPNCEANHYYLVNNYNLGYTPDGTPVDASAHPFTLPPQLGGKTIADALSTANVSWKYYIGGRGDGTSTTAEYCGICDPLIAYTSVMSDPAKKANLQDLSVLYTDIQADSLPAVSFVRPLETMAGHPADSIQSNYENFVTDLVNTVHRNPDVWKSTAIILTEDEGGGYYDSGYVQPVDFFGDGTRIPVIIVSPYAKEGFVDHAYYDHVSILKFIERNWGLSPLSARSRDNLPNPVQHNGSYQPSNGPAIGDLMGAFDFHHFRKDAPFITVPGERKHHDD